MILLFVLFVSCKSDHKEEHVKHEGLEDVLLKSALKTNDNNIKEVFIVFSEGKKGGEFQPKNNFMFSLEKDNSYIRYTNFSEENISKEEMKDSILLAVNEKLKIANFFKQKNILLKDVYGDTIGEKPIWKICFMNKNGSIFKFIDINGEPQDQKIIDLKTSCDFLFEKIKKHPN
ncbi:hypothetical protein [uncultured Flavobacterium sp.]|uniref:hypothetical protein n=1 Tax=uncultured Flavobacterium sp. TaxID=165435 RepID=UPI00292DDF6C|nr:hypothetical protein [uncultured Flavobacterium sp.]